jgi:hypothetical protein
VLTEFFVLPLLPGLFAPTNFWLLGLSISKIHLFRGNAEGLHEVALPGIAAKLSEFIALEKPDHSLRGRASAGPSVGGMKGVQFDTGSASERENAHLHDFFVAIDRSIRPALLKEELPLILAAVPRELALYRKVSTYQSLCEKGIHGNPDSLGQERLHEQALSILHSLSDVEGHKKIIERAADRGCLATRAVDVIDTVSTGHVNQLMVSRSALRPGNQEEEVNWVILAALRSAGELTLTDLSLAPDGLAGILRVPLKASEPVETTQSAEI